LASLTSAGAQVGDAKIREGGGVPPDFDCERFGEGFLGQPVNAVSSLAFVVAGAAILSGGGGDRRGRTEFGLLVTAVGAGSVVLHGPYPAWADLAHDLPLMALVAFVAVDAASDLVGRRLSEAWWVVPTLALVPLVTAAPEAADRAQALAAVVAIGLSLWRARVRPEQRRTILTAMGLLGVAALIGTLTRSGAQLCRPDSLLQGHAVWHVLSALAMWRLSPAIGRIASGSGAAQSPVRPG
jgi:hypothetical protein